MPSYTIQPGDTLTDIARRTGVNLFDLVAANKFEDPDKLTIGWRIHIPTTERSPAQRAQAAVDLAAGSYGSQHGFSATGVPGGGLGGGTPSPWMQAQAPAAQAQTTLDDIIARAQKTQPSQLVSPYTGRSASNQNIRTASLRLQEQEAAYLAAGSPSNPYEARLALQGRADAAAGIGTGGAAPSVTNLTPGGRTRFNLPNQGGIPTAPSIKTHISTATVKTANSSIRQPNIIENAYGQLEGTLVGGFLGAVSGAAKGIGRAVNQPANKINGKTFIMEVGISALAGALRGSKAGAERGPEVAQAVFEVAAIGPNLLAGALVGAGAAELGTLINELPARSDETGLEYLERISNLPFELMKNTISGAIEGARQNVEANLLDARITQNFAKNMEEALKRPSVKQPKASIPAGSIDRPATPTSEPRITTTYGRFTNQMTSPDVQQMQRENWESNMGVTISRMTGYGGDGTNTEEPYAMASVIQDSIRLVVLLNQGDPLAIAEFQRIAASGYLSTEELQDILNAAANPQLVQKYSEILSDPDGVKKLLLKQGYENVGGEIYFNDKYSGDPSNTISDLMGGGARFFGSIGGGGGGGGGGNGGGNNRGIGASGFASALYNWRISA